jgi:hypothetical protein
MSRGTWVIIGMICVGVAASLFAWAFVWRNSQRLLKLWGGDVASMIRTSPRVELLRLARGSRSGAESIRIKDQDYQVELAQDVTHRPGLIHARAALISDASFDWDRQTGEANWQFALRFIDARRQATLAFDLESAQVICIGRSESAALSHKITQGLQTFFRECDQPLSNRTSPWPKVFASTFPR